MSLDTGWLMKSAYLSREGARFTPGCSGSAVWASHMPLSKFHDLQDTTRTCTMREELERIGYCGPLQANYEAKKLSAHVELHIEQRRLLQDAKRNIGVVTAIQGIRWYRISVVGQRAHAGSTPMAQRGDALVAAAEMILFATGRAREVSAVATVGVLELDRPSSNTVPGRATFTLDLRHPSESVLDDFESGLRSCIKRLTVLNDKLQTSVERIWHSPAVQLDETVVSCVRKAAGSVVGQDGAMDMISLAGHDSALTALRVPTAMIFVPSKDGISHSPEEFTSEEEWLVQLFISCLVLCLANDMAIDQWSWCAGPARDCPRIGLGLEITPGILITFCVVLWGVREHSELFLCRSKHQLKRFPIQCSVEFVYWDLSVHLLSKFKIWYGQGLRSYSY